MSEGKKRAVAQFRPRGETFLRRVQELAANTANIKWSLHARDRMEERGIPNRVALTVLRKGVLRGEITPGNNRGEWRAKIVRAVHGRREVGAVVILVRDTRILVKTVEWEDPT